MRSVLPVNHQGGGVAQFLSNRKGLQFSVRIILFNQFQRQNGDGQAGLYKINDAFQGVHHCTLIIDDALITEPRFQSGPVNTTLLKHNNARMMVIHYLIEPVILI
ncbi:hypothetical protein D3C85_1448580 [compost metagenome]